MRDVAQHGDANSCSAITNMMSLHCFPVYYFRAELYSFEAKMKGGTLHEDSELSSRVATRFYDAFRAGWR
jgi:hypothetical protein